MKNHENNLIVLRKIPYSETSLIINGISPNLGRIDLLAKGAKRIEKKKFPEIDLFNEIKIFFRESRTGTVHVLAKSELESSALDMANYPKNLALALEISKFILTNTHFNMHTKRLYVAFKNMLANFARSPIQDTSWEIFIKLVYLDEQGFLPKYENKAEFAKFANMLNEIFLYCKGEGKKKPALSPRYLDKLRSWTESVCQAHRIAN